MTDATAFRDEMFAAFRSAWSDLTPVHFENVHFDPADENTADGWVSIRFESDPGALLGVGARKARVAGDVVITCYGPGTGGSAAAYALAERALSWLEAYDGATDSRRLRNPGILERGVDGGWYVVECRASFTYDTD